MMWSTFVLWMDMLLGHMKESYFEDNYNTTEKKYSRENIRIAFAIKCTYKSCMLPCANDSNSVMFICIHIARVL